MLVNDIINSIQKAVLVIICITTSAAKNLRSKEQLKAMVWRKKAPSSNRNTRVKLISHFASTLKGDYLTSVVSSPHLHTYLENVF